MSDWPGNDGKVTPHSNFKLSPSERPSATVRGFLFEFSVILEVYLPSSN